VLVSRIAAVFDYVDLLVGFKDCLDLLAQIMFLLLTLSSVCLLLDEQPAVWKLHFSRPISGLI
jgi:hypothetical protein